MSRDPRIDELHRLLGPLATVKITAEADELSVVIDKPVDIQAIDHALLRALDAEPLDRFERADSWRIRLMKREQRRPSDLKYHAVRIMDSYYEYRPQLPG